MNKGQNDSKARKKKKKTTKISKRSPNKDKEKTISRVKLNQRIIELERSIERVKKLIEEKQSQV